MGSFRSFLVFVLLSSPTILVTAGRASEVQISGLQDVNFGTVQAEDNNAQAPITVGNICVYLTTAAAYTIEIDSESNPGTGTGALVPSPLNGSSMPYIWNYVDVSGQETTGLRGLELQGSNEPGCLGGEIATLTITTSDTIGIPAGQYSDTLILTVSPL